VWGGGKGGGGGGGKGGGEKGGVRKQRLEVWCGVGAGGGGGGRGGGRGGGPFSPLQPRWCQGVRAWTQLVEQSPAFGLAEPFPGSFRLRPEQEIAAGRL